MPDIDLPPDKYRAAGERHGILKPGALARLGIIVLVLLGVFVYRQVSYEPAANIVDAFNHWLFGAAK